MALIDNYANAPRVDETDLDVRWEKQIDNYPLLIDGSVSFVPCWRCNRYAARSYRYTGMSQSAAASCAAAKRAYYTRTYYTQEYDRERAVFVYKATVSRQAEVSARRVGASDMWECSVNVNEHHEVYMLHPSGAPTDAECESVLGSTSWGYEEGSNA